MTRPARGGRRGFYASAAAVLVAALVGGVLARALAPVLVYPSWGQLPSPQVFVGVDGLAKCAIGSDVDDRFVPVALWSGAVEEWCATDGLAVVAFDGPGVPLWAKGVKVDAQAGLVTGAESGRQLEGTAWISGAGWVAVVAWGDPRLPSGTAAVLLGLRESQLRLEEKAASG